MRFYREGDYACKQSPAARRSEKADIEARVKAEGLSVNGLMNRLLMEYLEMDERGWKDKA